MKERRLLLVGGNVAFVERLHRLLANDSPPWLIEQSASRKDAIQTWSNASIDLVLVGLGLPAADAEALLTQLRNEQPQIARIATEPPAPHLASESGVARLAQRTVQETTSDSDLLQCIKRTTHLQHLIANETVRNAVGRLDRLPSVPRTYWALVRATAQRDSSLTDISRILESDPAMSAKLLHLANSAFFGQAQRITSIARAISLIGIDMLKGLVLTAHVFSAFQNESLPGFSLESFQSFSMRVARLAKRFLAGANDTDVAFTTGLLHDLGQLIIALRFPSQFAEINQHMVETGAAQLQAEREILGVGHAEIGAYLLGTWGLPYPIIEAVAFHHEPSALCATDGNILAAVHAADALLGIYACGDPEDRLDIAFLDGAGFTEVLPQWRTLAQQEAAMLGGA